MKKYICESCKHDVTHDQIFCDHCGKLLSDGSKEVEETLKHPDTLGEGAKKRKKLTNPDDVWAAVMKEFQRGTLYSGSGKKVTTIEQARAIAYSETERFRK